MVLVIEMLQNNSPEWVGKQKKYTHTLKHVLSGGVVSGVRILQVCYARYIYCMYMYTGKKQNSQDTE